MAKIAFAYLRLGLSPDQIGFILPPSLDAQPSVLFCLFRHHFHLADDELNKLFIGSEYDFQIKKPREVIIRSTPCPSQEKFVLYDQLLPIYRFDFCA